MSTTEVRSGLKFGWAFGETGWNTEMDDNLKRLGRFGFHLSVLEVLSTPPSEPTEGDSYIVGGSPSGAWSGWQHRVALWDGAAWQSATPRAGWLAWNEDTEALLVFSAGSWQSLAAL